MKTFKRSILLFMFIALFSVLLVGCGGEPEKEPAAPQQGEGQVSSESKAEPVTIKIGTLDVGSGYYSYGSLFADMIRKELPENSIVEVLPYAGTIGNVDLVAKGEADIGLSTPFVINWATQGVLAYEGKKYDNIRLLVPGLGEYYFSFIAQKDAPIESIRDIKDKNLKIRLATQPNNSLGDYGGRLLLEAYGLNYDDIEKQGGKVTHSSSEVIKDDMKDRRADVLIQYLNVGHPAVTDIATLTPVKFIPIESEEAQYLKENYGFDPLALPAGTFRGQDEDVNLVGGFTSLFGSTEMSDEVAYSITKALVDNYEYLQSNMTSFKEFTPERAVTSTGGIPLHPGAEKYYREKGLID